jgi:ribonuclease HI
MQPGACYKNDIMTLAEAEVWSLLQGLEWIASLDYNKVIIEMDCKMVVEDTSPKPNRSSPKPNRSEYDFIMGFSIMCNFAHFRQTFLVLISVVLYF